jgi:RNA polymerase sigma-70 factor, ECF subfamily
MDRQEDNILFRKIKNDDKKAFEILFRRYYNQLCLYGMHLINNKVAAEEIVQNFFVGLWEKRNQLTIETSVKNYLFRSIKNHCLNYIQHHKIKKQYRQEIFTEAHSKIPDETHFIEPGLSQKIEESIQSLPEKRRNIFRLSREEGLKYREIAEKLNISIKTVETQMGLAIKTLREKLKDFYSFLLLFFSFF